MARNYNELLINVEKIISGIERAALEGDRGEVGNGTLAFTKILGENPGVLPMDDFNRYTERFRLATKQGVYYS
ncbi:MAG: hypothetical protein WD876_01445 [Candidatus Pacearchaeota archaeon]